MLKQLGLLTGRKSRRTKNTNPVSETAAVTATATAEEEAAAVENDCNKSKEEEAALESAAPQTVSVVSKEQAMQLLKPDQAAATRKRSGSKSTSAAATVTTTPTHEGADGDLKSSVVPPEAEAETGAKVGDASLEGKFVNLVDLLLPVPSKGEFDVNKIKSSLYFFS